MSKALLALQLLPTALANNDLAKGITQQPVSDSMSASQGLAKSLISDLLSSPNKDQGVGSVFGTSNFPTVGTPIDAGFSKFTDPLQAPVVPTEPKLLYQAAAPHDYSGLHNPLLDSWGKEGLLNNPLDFNHYESADKKFPFVGPHYQKMGDEAGYWYDPYTDKYYQNKNTLNGIEKGQGALPKKPSLLSQLLPVLGASGATAAGQGIANSLFGGSSDSGGVFGKLLSGLFKNSSNQEGVSPSLGSNFSLGSDGGMFGNIGGESSGLGTDGLNLFGGGSEAGMGATPFAPIALTVLGSMLAGKDGLGVLTGAPDDNSATGTLGRIQDGITTGGISEGVRKAKHIFGF